MNPHASTFVPKFGPPAAAPAAASTPDVTSPPQEEDWEAQAAPSKVPASTSTSTPAASETTPEFTDEQLRQELKRMAMEEGVKEEDLLKDDGKEEVKDDADGSQEELDDPREHLNVVFIGHVDAGKSTLSGSILLHTGKVDQRTIEKYEKEAKEKNRESWYLAYIMDTNEEERAKGKTVEVGRAAFETATKRYTILDAPGHKNYVPNMIGGAQQADIGILVISARKGEFETGFNRGGQTREHTMLAKTLGVKYLVIVINKMDDPTVEWAEERYNDIVSQLTPFTKQVGYSEKDIFFVPIAAIKGTNIKDPMPASVAPWYKGLSLLGTLDAMKPMDRSATAPLRIPVIDKMKEGGKTYAMGKIESGTVSKGDSLLLMPGRIPVKVLGIYTDSATLKRARAGENIKIALSGVEEENIHRGFVLCDSKNPSYCQTKFECQLAILELLPHKSVFTAGYSSIIHIHTAVEETNVLVLLEQYDKKTGKSIQKKPKFVKNGAVVRAILECAQPVCAELFSEFPQLGRFTLRDEGRTIAIGKITSFGPKKQN